MPLFNAMIFDLLVKSKFIQQFFFASMLLSKTFYNELKEESYHALQIIVQTSKIIIRSFTILAYLIVQENPQ